MDHAHCPEQITGKVDYPNDETSMTSCYQPDPLLGENLMANALCRLCSWSLMLPAVTGEEQVWGDGKGGIVNMLG